MLKRRLSGGRRRASKRLLDGLFPASDESVDGFPSADPLSLFYSAGPILRLGASQTGKQIHPNYTADVGQADHKDTSFISTVVTLPTLQGTGPTRQVSAHGQTVRLEGRTDATFDGGAFHTEGVRARPGAGCESCGNPDCRHLTGTLVATYSVATTVTLPRVTDFPDLTPCQRARVQNAITTILAPHEQQHVAAFRRYNGRTQRQFDLTLCRSDFESTIRAMFEAEESARRSAAQAASDALDPFHFDVDLDCEERPTPREGSQQTTEVESIKNS